jgi:Domain of unknown function (DUF1996)
VTCPAGTMLESYLDFPHCWNGRDLDSADHKSHMSYPVGGACPASHPVVVPELRQVMRYPVNGNPAGFRLASGPGYPMHGDFFQRMAGRRDGPAGERLHPPDHQVRHEGSSVR